MQFRIDASGNTIVSPDTATTSSKLVALYLVTALAAGGNEVTYDPNSVISDIQYDFDTHELSWLEQGHHGRQTVNVDNGALRAALGLLREHAALPSASDIATAVAQSIDLSGLATLQSVADARDAVIEAIPNQPDLSSLATADQMAGIGTAISSLGESVVQTAVYAANESTHASNELEILDAVRDLRGRYCKDLITKKKEN